MKERYRHEPRKIQRVRPDSESLVVGIPMSVCKDKGLQSGDMMEFVTNGTDEIIMRKKG